MSTTPDPLKGGADALSSAGLARWIDELTRIDINAGDAELIDQISQLERLKSACAAAQAVATVAFVRSQTEGLSAAEAKDERAYRSIAAQVALARKDSPVRGNRHVGMAKALTREMPNTFAALQAGEISEWRATLLLRETACLSVEHRQQVDAELAGKLSGLGDKGITQAAAKIAQRLDVAACVKRNRKAVNERRVSIRPAPDTMSYVSALLPVAAGVAVWAALTRHADIARATGDTRGRGQVMADEFVVRITQPAAAAGDDVVTDGPDDLDAAGPVEGQDLLGSATSSPGDDEVDDGLHDVDTAGPDEGQSPSGSATSNTGGEVMDDGQDDEGAAGPIGGQNASNPATVKCGDQQSAGVSDPAEPQHGPGSSHGDGRSGQTVGVIDPPGMQNPTAAMSANGNGAATVETAGSGTRDHLVKPTEPDSPVADASVTKDAVASSKTGSATTTPAGQPAVPAGVNLDIQLVMTDRTLFDGDNEPAHLIGFGPIPAPLARQLIRDAGPSTKAWIRRLYTDPTSGQLINGDARRRFFGHVERQFFTARDQFCRRPYCGAPIRHSDHVEGHARGPADLSKGQGLCEGCNYSKEAPGWTSRVETGTATVTTTTPTGHTYRSEPPAPPRSAPWAERDRAAVDDQAVA